MCEITNLFPFDMKVTVNVSPEKGPLGATLIPAKRSVHISAIPGHMIFFYRVNSRGEDIFVDSLLLTPNNMHTHLGDIAYEQSGDTQIVNIHSHIPYINLHNHTTMPITLWFAGNRAAVLIPLIEFTHFSNNGNGFKLGDCISLTIGESKDQKPWLTFTLNDNFIRDIHLGIMTHNKYHTPDDIYAYNIDTPNIVGIPYYS